MSWKTKIGIAAFVVLIAVWFVDTNNKFLEEQALKKSTNKEILDEEQVISEPSEKVAVNEIPEEASSTPAIEPSSPAEIESEGQSNAISCMQYASENAAGDYDAYQKLLDECRSN